MAARVRQGNLDAWRTLAKATGRELVDDRGMLTYFSLAPAPNFNPTIVYEPLADPDASIAARAAAYEARGLAFGFEIPEGLDERCEAAARARGMTLRSTQPAMVLHPVGALPDPDPRVRVVSIDDFDEHLQVAAAGFGDTPDALRVFSPLSMLEACLAFTAYDEDGTPAATALTCVTGRDAGVFGVATLPAYRRRGLGTAATLAAIRAAAAAGAELVWLHASEMGEPVYERLGFVTVDLQRIYAPVPSSAS